MKDLSSFDSAFIKKLNEIIFTNLENEHFGVKELAYEMGMSRFKINSKLHVIFQNTTNQYIREVRLLKALEMLQQKNVTASEVAFKVGFSSPSYFNTCFSEHYGYPPGEVKRRSLCNSGDEQEEIDLKRVKVKRDSLAAATALFQKKKWIKRAVVFVSFIILPIIIIAFFSDNRIHENLNFFTSNQLKKQKKSIAVLPFINDSNDLENLYFINGVMEAILDNLSKVKELEVHPRTSVEQYRNNKTKTISQMAKELNVNYIIEGSGQKIGDQVNLYIQLIDVRSDKHLFSNNYKMKLEDIFNLQSEVAIKVASEIETVITAGEKELIKKPPTTSIAAWEMYSRGFELHNIADFENNIEFDKQAKNYFNRAIKLDSTYAEPYVQLGWIYEKYSDLDSAFFFANKALNFDHKNANAYGLLGVLFTEKGIRKKAEEAFNLAIQYNPHGSSAYNFLAERYFNKGDNYNAIKYILKALKLENNSIEKRYNLISLWDSFNSIGLYKEGEKYAEELTELTGDSTYYYWSLLHVNFNLGNYNSVVKYADKIYNTDSLNLGKLLGLHHSYFLGNTYLNLRDYKEAYRMLEKYTNSMKQQGRKIEPDFYLGYIYLKNGRKKEADFHFEESIKYRLQIIEQNKPAISCAANLGLTFIYAAIGEKEKALKYLRIVNSQPSYLYLCSQISRFKISPMVDCIRNEPEYKEFLKNAESRYLKEHNKVERLLQAEGLLISTNK